MMAVGYQKSLPIDAADLDHRVGIAIRPARLPPQRIDYLTVTRRKVRFMPELTNCYDCASQISFSARACPHCGSTEPAGPYQHTAREKRRLGAEARNDHTLIVTMLTLGLIGCLYGYTSHSGWAPCAAFGYGVIGTTVGAPLAALLILLRSG